MIEESSEIPSPNLKKKTIKKNKNKQKKTVQKH